jgi:hypothetical protein
LANIYTATLYFLAISPFIGQYLYSHTLLSCYFPLHWPISIQPHSTFLLFRPPLANIYTATLYFLAISPSIGQYLYSHTLLSCYFPLHWPISIQPDSTFLLFLPPLANIYTATLYFLAISLSIGQYLYSETLLSCYFPLHWPISIQPHTTFLLFPPPLASGRGNSRKSRVWVYRITWWWPKTMAETCCNVRIV